MPEPGRDAWWGMASVQENKPADVFPKTIIVNDGAYSSQKNENTLLQALSTVATLSTRDRGAVQSGACT